MDILQKIWNAIKIAGISVARFFKFTSLKIARLTKTISVFIWNKIKSPSKLALVLFYVGFVVLISATLYLLIIGKDLFVLQYILYVASALALAYFVYTIIIFAPKLKNNIIALLKRHKFTDKLLTNFGFRTFITSCFSFIFNLAFVIFQGVLAIKSKSYWYASITAYYLILCFMKGNVFLSKIKDDTKAKQLKTYKSSGIMFILLTIALSGIIVLIYKTNRVFEYAGLAIYVVAAYTFFNLSMSIYNLIKSRKLTNYYVQNLKNVNLAHSVFSLFVLQVALFQAFSPESNTGFANALTGGVVCLFILSIGILMITRANKNLSLTYAENTNSTENFSITENLNEDKSQKDELTNTAKNLSKSNPKGELNEKH